jgi:hypothetical protein
MSPDQTLVLVNGKRRALKFCVMVQHRSTVRMPLLASSISS